MESLSHIGNAQSFIIWILRFWFSYNVIRYCLTTYRRSQHARKLGCEPVTPYPHIDPILGLDLLYRDIKAIERGHLLDEFDNRFKNTNGGVDTYSSVFLGSRHVHTIDPENVKAIFRTNWKDYGHSAARKATLGYFGKGIFINEGAEWEASRSMLRPSFNKIQIRNLDTLEEHVSNLIAQVLKEGDTVDLQPLFFRFATDTIFEALMGEKLNCLLGGDKNSQLVELANAIEYVSERAIIRLRIGPIGSLMLGAKFWKCLAFVNDYMTERISRALASQRETSSTKKEQASEESLGEHQRYVFLHEVVKVNHDVDRVRAELLHCLGAGRNPTAGALSVLFYTIARRPDVLQKIQQEILNQVGSNPPTYENLCSLKYLRWTVNESQSLLPQGIF
jgi:Cytochrome P450